MSLDDSFHFFGAIKGDDDPAVLCFSFDLNSRAPKFVRRDPSHYFLGINSICTK